MARKNLALGRGLGAILGEVEQAYENNLSDNSELVVELEIDNLKPNPFQPRKQFLDESVKELAESIVEHGLLQPVLVYENTEGEYVLIAGERRLRASKVAGKSTIKAIVVNIDLNRLKEIALIENIQREDLNPIDLANSYKELLEDYDITHEDLSKKIKKSRTQITNTLRLLNLSKEIQGFLVDGKITQGHAKILVSLSSEEQKLALDSILGQKLSVKDSESLVKKIKENKLRKKNIKNKLEQSEKNNSKKNIIELESLFKKYFISSFLRGNTLVLKISDSSRLDVLIEKLSQD